jgi:hypothetical protein
MGASNMVFEDLFGIKTLLAGLRPETRTGLFAEFFHRFLPGEFDVFEEVGQVGGEELDELSGKLWIVHARLLSPETV